MGDLSQHFNRIEFACKCGRCGQSQIDYELVKVLERLRSVVAAPITITSGNRCYEHNLNVGGAERSKHLFSVAADFQVQGYGPEEIYKILDEWYPDQYGIGLYKSWVHLDVRSNKTRWDKS